MRNDLCDEARVYQGSGLSRVAVTFAVTVSKKVVVELAVAGRRLVCCIVLEQEVENVLSNHSANDHMWKTKN